MDDVTLEVELLLEGAVAIVNPGTERAKQYRTLQEAVDSIVSQKTNIYDDPSMYGSPILVIGDVTGESAQVPSGTTVYNSPFGDFRPPTGGDLRRPYHRVTRVENSGYEAWRYELDPEKVRVRFEPVDGTNSAVVLTEEGGAVVAATVQMGNIKDDLYYMLDRTRDLTADWIKGEKVRYGIAGSVVTDVGLPYDPAAHFFRARVTDDPAPVAGDVEPQPVEPGGDDPVEEFYTYEDIGDGTVRITGISSAYLTQAGGLLAAGVPQSNSVLSGRSLVKGISGALDIPSVLGGKPVAEIADRAFAEIGGITGITVPTSVLRIGEAAFKGCKDIKTLNLQKGLQKIAESAFEDCELLETLGIPGSVLEIGKAAFKGCKKIRSLTFRDGLKTIAESAFQNCELLEKVGFPSTLIEIGAYAFDGTRICEMVLPKALKWLRRIKNMPFLKTLRILSRETKCDPESTLPEGCEVYLPPEEEQPGGEPGEPGVGPVDPSDIGIPPDVPVFIWSDYTTVTNDDGTVLITGCLDVPSDGTLTVPTFIDSCLVVGIAANATFSDRAPLTAMTLPASVDWLGANAFANATALLSLTFEGDAPQTDGDVGLNGGICTVYAQADTTGWTNPWQGCQVVQSIRYWDPESKSVQTKVGCFTLTPDMETLEDGEWYVVQDAVTITNLAVNGAANLILADGATLTATGLVSHAGITVADGNALTVWGQGGCTGALVATGGSEGAGIGGGANAANGTVTINGGQVTAQGGAGGPGIGGGKLGAGGTVKVNGGTVVAKAAGTGTWDVGSGWGGDDQVGEFVVAGGSVHLANSGNCRAGYPQNVAEAQLYCVTVEDLEGLVSLEDLDGYGTDGIFADADGKVYLYLPNGTYSFTANDVSYTATVADSPTTAVAQ